MNRSEILKKIKDAGVVGAGGGGFPTYKKLDARVEHIIANGAECEPLLYKDREVMLRESADLLKGLRIMQEVTSAKHVTIAVKMKNSDVAEILRPLAQKQGVEIFIYGDIYPAGDEYVLVYEITGRRIPPGGIPLDIGCVVNNVETIVNVARALEDKPVTHKYITVTGEVKNAVTICVPIGTSFRECIEMAGGLTTDKPAVINGGVMMGDVEMNLDTPVIATSSGIIVLPEDHYLVKHKSNPVEVIERIGHWQCDQCSQCTEMCPRYLLGYPVQPHKVMRTLLLRGKANEQASLWAQFCCECNVCSYIACPEGLDPKSIMAKAKKHLREQGLSRSQEELEDLFKNVHPVRFGREVPSKRVYQKTGINKYDRHADFINITKEIETVKLMLNAHIGKTATSIVETGAMVKRGDKIAIVPDEALGCPVHSGIDGKVLEQNDKSITIGQ